MSDAMHERDYPVDEVQLDGLRVSVRRVGDGEPILLLHGFPHTKDVWREIVPTLVAAGHQVVAPDLRGTGNTERAKDGFDAENLAMDQVRLLDALSMEAAHVVGFDLGAAPAFTLAAAHPTRVLSLTIVEAVIAGLPGAERFLSSGAPWWFGFHQMPGGLAEDIVVGSEDRYVRSFLQNGSRTGVPEDLARLLVAAYTGRDSLRAAFDHYRAMPANARWNQAWAEHGRLSMPVTAIGASTVQDAIARQLAPISDDFEGHLLADSGHIAPLDAPQEVAAIVLGTARRGSRPAPSDGGDRHRPGAGGSPVASR